MLTEWARQLSDALGVDVTQLGTESAPPTEDAGAAAAAGGPFDTEVIREVLDLARDAAHAVERPAAPLTTFLVGFAAAQRGGGADALTECVAIARELTRRWEQDASS
ncbi:DUF6457 domain-containing protein [Actinopolymorpha alba]|uniref:DUF6457 domain-containing protein n=1 Tax=Actinopolymorpha alba TaxID=533267 RepID=UPI0003750109|nr:DUF6457 domain-containing protein [Actinopolymorpha alba]